MFKDIEVQKFKKFKTSIKIENLSSVNYLVGKNNSGKSSFLQAILLSTLRIKESGTSFSNVSFPEKFAKEKEYFNDEDLVNPIKVVFNNGREKVVIESHWIASTINKRKTEGEKIPRSFYIPCGAGISMDNDNSSFTNIKNNLEQFGILPIERINSWVYHSEKHEVGSRSNKESDKFKKFKKIIKDEFSVKILLPEIDDDNQFHFEYLEKGKHKNLYLLGSGAQSIIYLIAAIVYLNDYDLILIDEPESHLHPKVQKKLGNVFKKLSDQFDIQFIVATQSPFVINSLGKTDNVYLFKPNKRKLEKEKSFIKTLVSMELGCEPSDVGAPENFVLLEESSMQMFLKTVNERFFKKDIQLISCGGIADVPNKKIAFDNILQHNILLKCTPIYLPKYIIITDKLTTEICRDSKVRLMKTKLKKRFIEMDFNSLEDAYQEEYLLNFIKKNKKYFTKVGESTSKKKIEKWIGEKTDKGRGIRKCELAKFVGNNIRQDDFEKNFAKIAKIFKE